MLNKSHLLYLAPFCVAANVLMASGIAAPVTQPVTRELKSGTLEEGLASCRADVNEYLNREKKLVDALTLGISIKYKFDQNATTAIASFLLSKYRKDMQNLDGIREQLGQVVRHIADASNTEKARAEKVVTCKFSARGAKDNIDLLVRKLIADDICPKKNDLSMSILGKLRDGENVVINGAIFQPSEGTRDFPSDWRAVSQRAKMLTLREDGLSVNKTLKTLACNYHFAITGKTFKIQPLSGN